MPLAPPLTPQGGRKLSSRAFALQPRATRLSVDSSSEDEAADAVGARAPRTMTAFNLRRQASLDEGLAPVAEVSESHAEHGQGADVVPEAAGAAALATRDVEAARRARGVELDKLLDRDAPRLRAVGEGIGSRVGLSESGTVAKSFAFDNVHLAERMSAFDHSAVGPVRAASVDQTAVHALVDEHTMTLVKMRTQEVDAHALFAVLPHELADEPVLRMRTSVFGLDRQTALRKILSVKVVIDAYAICLLAVFTILALWKEYVYFDSTHLEDKNHFDVPLFVTERFIQTGLTYISFPLMLTLLYGKRMMNLLFWSAVGCFVFAAGFPIIFCEQCGVMEPSGLSVLIGQILYFLAYVVVVLIAVVRARKLLPTRERILRNLAVPHMLGIVIISLYSIVLPILWKNVLTSDASRAIFRLTVHPVVFELALFSIRSGARSIRFGSPSATYVILIYFLQLGALYGRVLVMATASTSTTIIISVVLSIQEVFLRLSVGARDKLLFRLFRGKSFTHEEEMSKFATPRALRMRGELVALDMCLETSAMSSAAIAAIVFGVSIDGVRLSTQRLLLDLAVQLVLEYITDVSVMAIELRLNVPILATFWTRGNKRPWSHLGWTLFFSGMASWYAIGIIFDRYWGFLAITQQ